MADKIRPEDLLPEEGFADDFDAAISDAYFDKHPNEKYRAKTSDPFLILVLDGKDLDEPQVKPYSIGAKREWQVVDKGAGVVSKAKPDTKTFIKASRAGTLIMEMARAVGEGDVNKGLESLANRGHYMTEAGLYIGLNFHWLNKKMAQAGTNEDGTVSESDVLLPVAYLGEGTTSGKSSASSGTKSDNKGTEDSSNLETLIVTNATGKTDRELKAFVMNNAEMKKNPGYQREAVTGTLLADLEKDGKLTKDPDGRYL